MSIVTPMSEQKPAEVKKKEYESELKKTAVPMVFGIIAGISSFAFSGKNPPLIAGGAREMAAGLLMFFLFIFFLTVIFQRPILSKMGVPLKGPKDWLYISFLTFDTWFVTWAILLMSL